MAVGGNRMTLTETLHGIICEVCNKRFSGQVPAQQHLQSAQHIRKERQQSSQSEDPLWCKECSVLCNSSQQYVTHCYSPRHLHMVEQVSIIRHQQVLTAAQQQGSVDGDAGLQSQQDCPSLGAHCETDDTPRTEPSSDSVTRPANCRGYYPLNPLADSEVSSIMMNIPTDIPPGGVFFENNRGHCYVCGIELTSLQHKKQHVEGKQHKKKAVAFGGGIADGGTANGAVREGVMVCSICDVPLSGDRNVKEHFNSDKHKNRKADYDRMKASNGSTEQYVTASPLSGLPFGSKAQGVTAASNPVQGVTAALANSNPVFDLRGPNSMPGQHVSFPGQVYQQQTDFQQALNSGQGNGTVASVQAPLPQSSEALKVEWLPDKQRGICQICEEEFGSSEDFCQHLLSAEHKQREEDINRLYCDICQVQYSGPVSAKQHLNSERHKKRKLHNQLQAPECTASVDFAKAAKNEGCLPNSTIRSLTSSELSQRMGDIQGFESAMRNIINPLPLNALDQGSRAHVPITQYNIPIAQSSEAGTSEVQHQQSQSVPVAQEYIFDGNRGKCFLCAVELTSKSHADSHLAGAKHQKKSVRWQTATAITRGMFGMQAQSSSGSSDTQGVSAAHDSGRMPQPYHFDGNQGYCLACKADLTSETFASQHLSGKKHQSAVERWLQERELALYPLYCNVCHKPFTGQESAAQHFCSEKHKKKVALSEGASTGRKDPDTGALMIVRNGLMWYMCETCNCPLNTPEQFRLHVNSARHNSEVEKSKRQDHSNRSSPVDVDSMPLLRPSGATTGITGVAPDPSDLQHLVTRSTVKTTPGAYIPPPQQTPVDNAGPIMPELRIAGDIKTEPGSPSASSQTSSGLKLNPYSNGGSAVVTGRSENGLAAGGLNGGKHPGYGFLRASNSSSQEQELPGSSNPSNPGHSASGNKISALSGLADTQGLAFRRISRSSAGSHGNKTPGLILRFDGEYELEDDSTRVLPTKSSTTNYKDQNCGGQQLQSQPAEEHASRSSLAMSSVQTGDELSLLEEEKRPSPSVTFTESDNMSAHTSLGSVMVARGLRPVSGASPVQQQSLSETSHFKGFRFACLLCRQPMNTKEDYERHMKGLKHQMKAATVCAPDKSQEALIKHENYDEAFDTAYKCCKTMPRTYQVELMAKAMTGDSTVVYLPTGTGKTLAAMMTLSRMLTLNPTRPVLFLVDKVLLVLQQARYIINELGTHCVFERPHLSEDGKFERRTLKVAVLCGGLSVRDGTPLWKHDVIVTTAAFCQNLLQEEVLRWANFSLVVFDEAHHCTKNHPYNKLLSEHHLCLHQAQRPKVLGLTASPAGRRTKEETLIMLKDLLKNLGGAMIATIEEKGAKEQLDKFSSSARLVPLCVPMTEAEMGFHEKLLSYFISAYVELMYCSNLHHISTQRLQALMTSKQRKVEDIKDFAQHLMTEPDELSEMVQLAQTARMKPNTVLPNKFENLRMHVMTVGMTLLNSEDGIDFVLDDLERLFNPDLNKYFDELTEMGLPCKEIAAYVSTLHDAAQVRMSEESDKGEVGSVPSMSIFQKLLETLANPNYVSWDTEDSMALVLVRERKVAHKFKEHLKLTSFVRERNMRVAVVVGHGAGSGEGEGMNLRKQDKVLQGIKSHRYDIVVATSVAEEGVDIPECQLVVCLNPPTTVKALVQMRGRARKKDSFFVVLCSSQREKEKLEDLQKQEINMMWAVAQLMQNKDVSQ